MTKTFSGFGIQIDWIPLIAGIFTITLGLGVGTWIWIKVFLVLVGLAYFSVLIGIPFILTVTHVLTTWQEILVESFILRLLSAFLLFPITAIYNMEEKIKKLEKSLKITGSNE